MIDLDIGTEFILVHTGFQDKFQEWVGKKGDYRKFTHQISVYYDCMAYKFKIGDFKGKKLEVLAEEVLERLKGENIKVSDKF